MSWTLPIQVNYGNCGITATSFPISIAFVTTSVCLTVALIACIYVGDRSNDSSHSSRQLQSVRYIFILDIFLKKTVFHIIEYEE